MTERKLKTLTTLTKVAGFLTLLASGTGVLPEKWAWIGLVVGFGASVVKDSVMFLGDLWDDGQRNQSYKG